MCKKWTALDAIEEGGKLPSPAQKKPCLRASDHERLSPSPNEPFLSLFSLGEIGVDELKSKLPVPCTFGGEAQNFDR